MKHILILFVFISVVFSALGQYSVGGGLSFLNPLDFEGTWNPGLNVIGEFPSTENQTFAAKLTIYAPRTTKNGPEIYVPETDEFIQNTIKDNLFSFDGGTRRYFFNTYDSGASMYGGVNLKATINTYRVENNDPNSSAPDTRGYAILGSVYGYLGFKYQLPYRSAVFIDAGFDLVAFPVIGSNPSLPGFFFTLNAGYRFDLF
ncbi:MAG: hypothetical protein ACPGU5_05275 [Lishizhenia sp.]